MVLTVSGLSTEMIFGPLPPQTVVVKVGLILPPFWTQAEFNVVGDMSLTQANFNFGSQITVVLQILMDPSLRQRVTMEWAQLERPTI